MVIASSPALAMAEGRTKGAPVHIQVTVMLTIAPNIPVAIQRLPTAWVTLNEPCKTMSEIAGKARGDRSSG